MMFPSGLYGIVLIFCIGQCMGQVLQISDLFNGVIGERVEFDLDSPPPPSSEILFLSWAFEGQVILASSLGVTTVLPPYIGRATLDTTTLALTLMNLTLNDTGTYMLTVTTNQQNVAQTLLVVYEKVSDITLTGPEEALIERKSIANLTCEGNGNITSVQWMRENNPLSPSGSVIFSSDNRSVSINPVFRPDKGKYQCTLANPVSSETAELTLIINYGPENVFIEGLSEVGLGLQMSLSCSADSLPIASIIWKFNGTETSVTTAEFIIEETNFTHSGDYICSAWNSITEQRVDSQTHSLVVKVGGGGGDGGDGGDGGGLSTGAIVGIVIGVLVAVASICGLIFYLTKTNKISKESLGKVRQDNKAPPKRQENELNYAEISHDQKSRGAGEIQMNVNEPRTEYAQITHGAAAKPQAPPPPYGSQASKPSSLPEGVTYAQVMKRT